MACPICDQKPMNCDCTPRERAMWQELDSRPSIIITDAERQAIKEAADAYEQNNGDPDCERIADTLHGLLDRLGGTYAKAELAAASESRGQKTG